MTKKSDDDLNDFEEAFGPDLRRIADLVKERVDANDVAGFWRILTGLRIVAETGYQTLQAKRDQQALLS